MAREELPKESQGAVNHRQRLRDQLEVKEFLAEFGNRLLFLRKDANMSLRELEARTGIDDSKLGKMQKGKVSITLVTLHQLLKGLGCTMKEFWDFDYIPTKERDSAKK